MSLINQMAMEMYNEDINGAKFKIGEQVIYSSLNESFKHFWNQKFLITAVNWADDNDDGSPLFEYSLNGFPFLVWEYELEKVLDSTECKKCGAPKTKFKCDYCGV